MQRYSYPNLARDWGWPCGVHRAPHGYEHRWLVVVPTETTGADTREEARDVLAAARLDPISGLSTEELENLAYGPS